MEKQLNALLSDFVVEYHKLQNHHWYVKGKAFFTVHAKLEEYYNFFAEAVDEIAENILMSGYQPNASLKQFLADSKIEESNNDYRKPKEVYKSMILDFEYLYERVIEVKKLAESEDNYLISNLMDNFIAHFKKSLWMLKQATME